MSAVDGKCEVCGGEGNPAGVASSGLGPVSLFYCVDCLRNGIEPFFVLVGNVLKKHEIHPSIIPIYEASLKAHGKTWDDLHNEIDELFNKMSQIDE